MHVAPTPELIRWLMGYDQDFRVMAPASLAAAIDRKVEGMSRLRRDGGSGPRWWLWTEAVVVDRWLRRSGE